MISVSHIHPVLVHFPIALVIFGFLADVASLFFRKEQCLSKTGFYLLTTGTVMAFLAWLSGTLFTEDLEGKAGEIMETHEKLALITLGILIIASALRIFLKTKERLSPAKVDSICSLFPGHCLSTYNRVSWRNSCLQFYDWNLDHKLKE